VKVIPAIAFDYRPSRWLLGAIGVAAALAFAALASCGLDVRIKAPIAFAGTAYAFWALRRFLRVRFDHVTWHSAGHWRLRDADAHERTGELVGATTVGALIVLTLRIGAKHVVALPLLPDNCDKDTRRVLRVRLSRGAARS
jgi:toxin CptA